MSGLPVNNNRYLIFPMEIVERELLGNTLLGIEAARRGWKVIFGTKRTVFDAAPYLPESLVYLKSIMACEIHNMRNLKKAGHKLACLDVEGLVYTSLDEFITTRFDKDTVAELEIAMFWGDLQRNAAAAAYPAHAAKFKTTGTPIVDLWRPAFHPLFQDEANALKARYGKYIIIPSSFASVNHFMGPDANKGILTRDKIIAEDKRDEFFKFWDEYEHHVTGVFEKFLKLIPEVAAAFPDHTIIVRPHPSESHDRWKDAARGMPNVTVIFEGPVSPWLLGADAVLHWGCTTGVEGYLMGKPVIAYNPVTPEEEAKFDHTVPHSISIMARTPAEVIACLTAAITNPQAIRDSHPSLVAGEHYLRQWICYTDDSLAAVNVITQLETVPINAVRPLSSVPVKKATFRETILRALAFITAPPVIHDRLPERLQLALKAHAYGLHKTRQIPFARLQSTVGKLAELRGTGPIKITPLANGLYMLEKTS